MEKQTYAIAYAPSGSGLRAAVRPAASFRDGPTWVCAPRPRPMAGGELRPSALAALAGHVVTLQRTTMPVGVAQGTSPRVGVRETSVANPRNDVSFEFGIDKHHLGTSDWGPPI